MPRASCEDAAEVLQGSCMLQRGMGNHGPLPALGPEEEQECTNLNAIESRMDASGNDVANFKQALAQWHAHHKGTQPACREEALGQSLKAESHAMKFESLVGHATENHWLAYMRELLQHEKNDEDSRNFAQWYVTKKWKPEVFLWPQHTPMGDIDDILSDGEYMQLYAKAGHLSLPYGAPQVPWLTRNIQGQAYTVRASRMQQLFHLRMLRKAVPSFSLDKIKQVVEFGGGSGDLAATVRDLGFKGTYFIYDMPPMLLMQRYWLRYSGYPALLGEHLPANASAVQGELLLESSLEQHINAHLDPALAPGSLFVATWSLTEADVASREKIRPLIMNFGVILVAFWDKISGIDNSEYMRKYFAEKLRLSHHILVWRQLRLADSWYFLAVHKSFGELTCNAEVNCKADMMHPKFRSFSDRTAATKQKWWSQ